ncbi:MAG: 4-hydroxy-3-methylbut-2-enyl diphosphate reductase [Proteobacteria bacterium]|nr:4-hydroxy-3-methylbut-2-enyl diphosphate reductase [Pseudomonadota bacterium]MBU2226271.1 4-hydroxy-3-methylbut-2-enyl diphosphate reductase [Pseudomonadota bacterium]MBU2261489.1 4-hydroxy-3-methylbut-2-enyl diphosphate reductase [Pseudomonadota bacterium]
MGVKLAKTAGFCMGVKRAVDMVIDMARRKGGETIYTYGPLIHNPQTVELLRKRGIVPVRGLEEIDSIPAGAMLVIRAHGVSPAERKIIKEKGFRIIDATCPKVGHVQAIIRKHAATGFTILIAGDREHPEVNGLLGFAGGAGIVLGSVAEVEDLPELPKVCVVAQTTQSVEEYAAICRRIRTRFPEAVVFDTICDSTEKRQKEIRELAAGTDAVFIVGGLNSANTQRLAELAKLQGKPAFHIETADELKEIDIEPYRRIGVSAGASTPNWIIDRVADYLTGRQGRKEEFFRRLFKVWVFAVRTDIYSAAGAGCLSLAAMLLQGIRVNPLHILTASLYVYAMHVLNRFINRKASSISSFREESYLLHERIYMTLAVLSLIIALGASLVAGPAPFILLFVISLAGALYNARLLPSGWRFQSLRDIPGSKNVAIAVAWGAVTALLPWIETGGAPTPGLAVAFFFAAALVFIRSSLSDILDVQSDRLIGRETLPVLIGEKRTLLLLQVVSGLLFVLFAIASPAGWSTPFSFILLSSVFYIWICFKLYDRRSGFSGVVLEGLLESSYIVAGVGALLWLMAGGGVTA